MENKVTVIDAQNLVMGRLASHLVKRLLAGEEIHVVNSEKAWVTGRREAILELYKWHRDVGFMRKGPFFPRTPDRILKRSVRGMLDYNDKPSHRAAFRRLRTYIGVPKEFAGKPTESIEGAKMRAARGMTLGQIAESLGFKVVTK